MIRINLLPYREEKKKANVQRQIAVGAVSLGLFFLLLLFLHLHMRADAARLEVEVEAARARLDTLVKVAGGLQQVTADKETLKKKIEIIRDLERNRGDSVHIMDELASRISPQTEWLTGITKKGGRLRLEGVAVNNPAVAQFMRRLEASPYIGAVDLIASKQTTVAGVKLMGFVLLCAAAEG